MSNRQLRRGSSWAPNLPAVFFLFLALCASSACGGRQGAVSAAVAPDRVHGSPSGEDPSARAERTASVAPEVPSPPAVPGAPSAPSPVSAIAGVSGGDAVAVPVASPPAGEGQGAQRAPLLVYTATLTLAVFSADVALDAVERLALDKSGYLVRRSDRSITIRVPAESFHEALDGVGKLGDELHRDVNAQDVTHEFADLKLRLRNAEVVRQRLEVLLERASKVEEALAVQRELERVTRDIEQIKGRMALLGELIRFSTITVQFEAVRVETVARDNPLPFEWLQRLGLPHLLKL